MNKNRKLTLATFALAALAGAMSANAQEPQERRVRVESQKDVVITRTPQGPVEGANVMIESAPGQGDTFVFVSGEMSIDGKIVKGAPYSAQAVTEMIQTLGDGNRIVRKNTANVYRDSEGRTRRDQTLGAIGPFAVAGDPPQTVFINDPVAGVNLILDPRTRTARKLQRFEYKIQVGADKLPPPGESKMRTPLPGKEVEAHGFVFTTPPPGVGPLGAGPADVHFFGHTSKAEAKTEKLEKRMIEGVEAEGTRTTVTIPAGEVGNELPMEIVTERWYSPELQTVVMTRHSDPRFGENTYKLTNINRAEPAATLFQAPSDYTIKEAPAGVRRMREMRRPGDLQ
jgi:hypothetical protein